MFCRESSFSSLQTLNIAKSLSSMFHKPSALIKPSARHPDKLRGSNLSERCKVKASRSNIDQKCQIVKQTVKKIKVKGYITAQEELLEGLSWSRGLDDIADIAGRSLLVELISSEADLDFRAVETIKIQNQHHREMFIKEVKLELPSGHVKFTCESWVAPKSIVPTKRILTHLFLPCNADKDKM